MLQVVVDWQTLRSKRDPLWEACFCLYAYLHPQRRSLLYVGKADYCSIRQRWRGEHKDDLFDFFEESYGLRGVEVIQGEIEMPSKRRLSSALVCDIESLLIYRLRPPGNIAATRSRTLRPGLRVKCTGDWPLKRDGFWDV